jgi:hypothetical protein
VKLYMSKLSREQTPCLLPASAMVVPRGEDMEEEQEVFPSDQGLRDEGATAFGGKTQA